MKQQQQCIVKITKELVSSTNSEIRENALVSAQLWIESTHFERMDQKEMEMSFLRLWQGLFYSYWLTDGLEKQYQVAVIISEMIQLFNEKQKEASLLFMKTFYQTLIETWSKLDKHRVAKYMSLIRRFVEQSIVFLNKYSFDDSLLNHFMQMMLQGPLNINNRLIGSLQAHIITCLYPSMKKFGYENMSEAAFMSIMEVFFNFYAETFDTAVMKTIESELFEPMLHEGDEQWFQQQMQERMHDQDDPDSDSEEEGLIVWPINYKLLSEIMEKLSARKSTENREQCLQWKNKFYDRYMQSVDDPMTIIDDLEQELEQVRQQQKPIQQSVTKKIKKKAH
jgi:hypothetical protein